jgi:hypothetical protein
MRLVLLLLVAALAWGGEAELAAAAELDGLIDADLAARGLTAQGAADDATVLRRAWLDLGGRIPTAAEATTFLADQRPDRRQRMVEGLVGSDAWNMALFSWLADILRVQSRLQDRTPGQAWIDWLKASIASNRPWDALARDMLTATGPAFAADGGATGFALRDAGMPLDHAALTAQTFLGTRIGCAQCHDHPFDTWTRLDFLRFAAFSADARADAKGPGVEGKKKNAELRSLLADAPPEVRNATRMIGSLVGARVAPGRKDWLPVPDDYQYQDAKKGDHIAAAALFAPDAPPSAAKDADPRQRLAAWITSPQNPRFALAIGNRVWKRMFGVGLIEPVDDLRGDPAQPLPPLQARLAKLVVDSGFDLRRIHLTLALTRHWQRAAWAGAAPAEGGVAPGRCVQRLSAQAWWDSLVTLAVDQPEARAPQDAEPLMAMRSKLAEAEPNELLAIAERIVALRKERKGAIVNDPELGPLMLLLQPRLPRDALLRASELPQPAMAGHPLRILGQSDRELIDNASLQPAATQALLMMNGVVDASVLGKKSRLMRDLDAIADLQAKLDHLWLAVLARHPSPAERERAATAAHDREGVRDVAWALLNGAEFRSVR